MEFQETNPMLQRVQSDPQCLFQITEEDDPNTKEPIFFVKIVITKQMKARMADLERRKKDRQSKIQQREKTPQVIALKQKIEAFKKLDPKSLDEQRKKNSGINQITKCLAQQDTLRMVREKISFPLFESFEKRGKSDYIKFSYVRGAKYLCIRINKNYFLNVLQLSRKDLFNIAISFTRTWQIDFIGMIAMLWKIYIQVQKPLNYNLYIRSLDLISVTFDVIYTDKRFYRFRYSPFEFRTSPTFKDDNQLTGYYQSLSCIPQVNPTTRSSIVDSDYYSHHRLFIFDDLTDGNLFYKILNRTNLFYQTYSISKGTNTYYQNLNEADDFIKKCLGQFYFSTTRLKKFIFTWPMRLFKRGERRLKMKEEQKETRQVIFHISFQLQRDSQPVAEPAYKMRMQILQTNRLATYAVKEDLSYRLKEWYLLNKELCSTKERALFQIEKNNMARHRPEKDILTEDFQTLIQFTSKDRFDKFFIGLLLLVSTYLDRHYFTLGQDKQRKKQMQKTVVLDTIETPYSSNRKQYINHIHSMRLVFKHSYLPGVFFATSREDQRQVLQQFLKNNPRNHQYRLKFGEWKLQKIMKIKKKINMKNKQDIYQTQQAELPNFPDEFKKYINTLLRHFPLRIIYKDILSFVQSVSKICYVAQEQNNLVPLNGYEHILKIIINTLLTHFYYSQFKDKIEKLKEKEKEKQKEKQKQVQKQRDETQDNLRRQKIEDTFSRVLFIKILTKGQIGFVPEQKLVFQVTFKLMECKTVWQTRLKEGYVVLRVFEDRIEFEKDYNFVSSLKGDAKKKIFDEAIIKSSIEGCFIDPKLIITL